MPLPDDLDHDKLAEAALAILALTAFNSQHESRAWKGLDWDVLDLLYRRGWIEDPVGKAKSVVLTEAGERLAPALLARHFAKARP
jgi:Domain of unknown function (DUF6429)